MENLNEGFYTIKTINEGNMRFEALQMLREVQGNLVGVSFLPVIGIMKPENPYIKDITLFQDKLDELTIEIQTFISDAKNGVDYEPAEGEGEEDSDGEEPKEEIPEEEPEEEQKEDDSEVEDSSEPKEK